MLQIWPELTRWQRSASSNGVPDCYIGQAQRRDLPCADDFGDGLPTRVPAAWHYGESRSILALEHYVQKIAIL